MYQIPTSTDTAKKLYELGEEQSIAVEAGKERFWTNGEDQALELLVIKTMDER